MSSKYIKTIGFPVFLGLFHAAFIILMGLFAEYNLEEKNEEVPTLYASKLTKNKHIKYEIGSFLKT